MMTVIKKIRIDGVEYSLEFGLHCDNFILE